MFSRLEVSRHWALASTDFQSPHNTKQNWCPNRSPSSWRTHRIIMEVYCHRQSLIPNMKDTKNNIITNSPSVWSRKRGNDFAIRHVSFGTVGGSPPQCILLLVPSKSAFRQIFLELLVTTESSHHLELLAFCLAFSMSGFSCFFSARSLRKLKRKGM